MKPSSFREKIKLFFFEKTEGKTTVRTNHWTIAISITLIPITIFSFFSVGEKEESTVAHSAKPLVSEEKTRGMITTGVISKNLQYLFEGNRKSKRKKRKKGKYPRLISYKKKQVLERNSFANGKGIPAGKKIIARLDTAIDSRFPSEVSATIPFSVVFQGETIIPENSTLLGIYAYPQGSNRIFISFSKCILPNGKQIPFRGQALDSSDYQIGIVGKNHSKSSTRLMKSIAMGMVSPMAETLTEKESLGNGYTVTPKPKLKNAFLQGLSKSSEIEAKRQIESIKGDRDYLTIPSGKEIIVTVLGLRQG